jgi:hypothetical protein
LGVQSEGGGANHPRLNTTGSPIAQKYREGRKKSNHGSGVKRSETGGLPPGLSATGSGVVPS